MKVKVLGAGSIGNHLSHAARVLGWNVDLVDVDESALERTKHQIYPSRYGAWDEAIRLFPSRQAPRGGYDLIVVGTPPDAHTSLALESIKEQPRAVLVEKPFCTPSLDGASQVLQAARTDGVALFTGYDHVVGEASEKFVAEAAERLSDVETLDVEFREFWGGIFAAHPWLDGPSDSYLGFSARGGGALGEHSHAINLWQHFAHALGAGRITTVQAMMDFVRNGSVEYDKLCLLNLSTESGLTGRVVQDVVTTPPRKWARAQGRNGFVEWVCGHKPGCDAVFAGDGNGAVGEHLFHKSRPDDFIRELRHIEAALATDPGRSPISVERGLDTMLVIAAAHESARTGHSVTIDYAQGYSRRALAIAERLCA